MSLIGRRRARLAVVLAACCVIGGGGAWVWPFVTQRLAEKRLEECDADGALKWLEWGRVGANDDAERLFLLARAYRFQGDFDRVSEVLKRLHERGADRRRLEYEQNLALAQSGRMSQAQGVLAGLLTDPDSDMGDVARAYALGYLRARRVDAALTILDAWIDDSGGNAEAYRIRGNVFLSEQKLALAEAEFQKAFVLAPERREVVRPLADVLFQLDRCEEAKEMYLLLLRQDSTDIVARCGVAKCAKAAGDTARAREILVDVIRDDPSCHTALYELGRLEFEGERFAKAIGFLKRAVDVKPWDDLAHYQLGLAFQRRGDKESAQVHLNFAEEAMDSHQRLAVLNDQIRQNRDQVDALVESGRLLLKYSDPNEGVVRLYAALDLDAGNFEAHNLLAGHFRVLAEEDESFSTLAEKHEKRVKELESHGAVVDGVSDSDR